MLILDPSLASKPCSADPGGSASAWRRSGRRQTGDRTPPAAAHPRQGVHDKAWLARVLAGDEAAAGELVDRLYPTVLKLVRSHLPRRSSEEDLVQAVFMKIFHHLDQFAADTAPLEHWVARITINTCLTQLKYETRRPELRWADLSEEEEMVVQRLACSDDEVSRDDARAARELLQRLLACLRPDERLVITLLHLEERSTEEISRLAGWSASCVKVKAFRARRKMRQFWRTLAA